MVLISFGGTNVELQKKVPCPFVFDGVVLIKIFLPSIDRPVCRRIADVTFLTAL